MSERFQEGQIALFLTIWIFVRFFNYKAADTGAGEGKFWKTIFLYLLYILKKLGVAPPPPPIFETVAGFLDIHTSTGLGAILSQ